MKEEVKLEQGSAEWLEWRRRYRMASETPAVMRLSPYSGWKQIREAKAGKSGFVNAAMRQGTEQEPIARAWFEDQTSELMRPAVFVNGRYGASLDGISLDGKSILEIKTPYTDGGDRWERILTGELTAYDMAQVQHQLMVSEAAECYFLVWSAERQTGALQVVTPESEYWRKIDEAWDAFEATLAAREDDQWGIAAADFLQAKVEFTKAEEKLEAAKKVLIDLRLTDADHGNGVRLSKVSRKGSVDWKAVQKAHLQGVDVEQYRGKSTDYYKVENDE